MEAVLKTLLSTFFKYFSKISPQATAKIAWSFFCKPRVRKKPLSNYEKDLLKTCQQTVINSDEYNICVYKWETTKKSSNAKTILLSHGWGGHALNFSHIISVLISNGYDVIAYDSPAHGNSSGRQTNLLYNMRALLAVANQKNNIYALIGHSFGNLANTYAIDFCNTENSVPKLTHVEKIILISSPDKVIDIFSSFTHAMQLPDSILEIFVQRVEKMTGRILHSMSASAFLENHPGQTLVIHDYDDRIVPLAEAEVIANNSRADLFTTTGLGHFRLLKAKSVVDKIVNFLH